VKAKRPLLELVLARGLIEDEKVARSLIMQGRVLVDGRPSTKPGMPIPEAAVITVRDNECPYVSRAGLKLKNCLLALDDAAPKIAGKNCLDIGSSTGGFTEVLLEYGAAKVYAVDVGKGLLDGRLRGDKRVVILEGVNAHDLTSEMVETCGMFTVDVSFTSAVSLLPALAEIITSEAHGLVLIKPQFERENDPLDEKRGWFSKGVVRSAELHRKVLLGIYPSIVEQGLGVLHVLAANPAGAKGNREFFLHLARGSEGMGEAEYVQDVEKLLAGLL
jgi:23S rRNA (cytidine1920-2'-O)/16S rRNA (cytidine1409-2'-O)-methyltransferase